MLTARFSEKSIHPGGITGRDRDHRHARRPAPAGGPERPRIGPPGTLRNNVKQIVLALGAFEWTNRKVPQNSEFDGYADTAVDTSWLAELLPHPRGGGPLLANRFHFSLSASNPT